MEKTNPDTELNTLLIHDQCNLAIESETDGQGTSPRGSIGPPFQMCGEAMQEETTSDGNSVTARMDARTGRSKSHASLFGWVTLFAFWLYAVFHVRGSFVIIPW